MTNLAIISVQPHTLGGLDVLARYSCGHKQQIWFPDAPKRSSRQELKGWLWEDHADEQVIRDEYGSLMTGREFLNMLLANCPIQFTCSIGVVFC